MVVIERQTKVKDMLAEMPFLNELVKETELSGRKKCRVVIKIDEDINLTAPFHDGCCRYTSAGVISNGKLQVKAHYAGCYDTCLCNPSEVLGSGIYGKTVKHNCFYAIADIFEHWKSRTFTVYMRSEESKEVETNASRTAIC